MHSQVTAELCWSLVLSKFHNLKKSEGIFNIIVRKIVLRNGMRLEYRFYKYFEYFMIKLKQTLLMIKLNMR